MIEINNLTTSSVDEDFLKKVAKKVLAGENKKNAELSVVFVGQGKMRELNKKYRGKNKVTDVLSFTWTRDSEARGGSLNSVHLSPFASLGQKRAKKLRFLLPPSLKLGRSKTSATTSNGLLAEVGPLWGLSSSRPFANAQVGEVVICLREVRKNAKKYKSTAELGKAERGARGDEVSASFEKELAKVVIHGVLHLLGYEHESERAQKDKMRKKEEYYLWQLKLT